MGFQSLREKFQRDGAVKPDVFSLVDDTHAAFTDLVEDFVMREGFADHRETSGTREEVQSAGIQKDLCCNFSAEECDRGEIFKELSPWNGNRFRDK